MPQLTGRSIIGFHEGIGAAELFYGINPASGQPLLPAFFPATATEVDLAANLASDAFAVYGRSSPQSRAAFLRAIANNLESIADELIDRAYNETALPKPRLQGETARTCHQLRLFAQ